jgi:hypothetical protein
MLKAVNRFMHKPRPWSYSSRILSPEQGNASLAAAIRSGRAFAAGRLGSVELNALERYVRIRTQFRRYRQKLRQDMSNNAGFFPTDDASLDEFGRHYAEAIAALDFIGVWFNAYEDLVIRRFCPRAQLAPLGSLEPYYFDAPWSSELEGKRVLVVHPFAASIRRSYEESREHLFENPRVLPAFTLLTLKAVQSNAGATGGFATWFEALRAMKERMRALQFDVCIVGAGAYGLPLASFAKGLGKQAIHMGGASQVLFGIIGRRWEGHPVIRTMINPAWRRPSMEETPPNARLVENGCYW